MSHLDDHSQSAQVTVGLALPAKKLTKKEVLKQRRMMKKSLAAALQVVAASQSSMIPHESVPTPLGAGDVLEPPPPTQNPPNEPSAMIAPSSSERTGDLNRASPPPLSEDSDFFVVPGGVPTTDPSLAPSLLQVSDGAVPPVVAPSSPQWDSPSGAFSSELVPTSASRADIATPTFEPPSTKSVRWDACTPASAPTSPPIVTSSESPIARILSPRMQEVPAKPISALQGQANNIAASTAELCPSSPSLALPTDGTTKPLSHYQGTTTTAVPTGAPRSPENIPKAPSTTAATIRNQITTIVDTFFETHDVDDAEEAFDDIPSRYHSRLVDALVSHAVESHDSRDTMLLERVFTRVIFTGACAPSAWEAGFVPTATTLCEIVMEKPSALVRFMRMFNAAGLDRDGERAARVLLRLGQGW